MAKEGLQIEIFQSDNYQYRISDMKKAIALWLEENPDLEILYVFQDMSVDKSLLMTFFVRYPKNTGNPT